MELPRNAKCWCCWCSVFSDVLWIPLTFCQFSYGSGIFLRLYQRNGYKGRVNRRSLGLRLPGEMWQNAKIIAKVVGNCGENYGGKTWNTSPKRLLIHSVPLNCCLNGGIYPFFQAHHPSFRRTQIDKNIQTRVSKLCFTCLTQLGFSRRHVGRLKGLLGPKKTGQLDKTKSSEMPFIHCLPWHLRQGVGKCPIWKIDLPSGELTFCHGKIHHFLAGKIHYFYSHFP